MLNLVQILGEQMYSLITYSYTVYANVGVQVDGHKGIKYYTADKLVLSLARNKLNQCNITITGEGLEIRYLTKSSCFIAGKITNVEVS